jgi:tRNA pseudouridine38-40 synthase
MVSTDRSNARRRVALLIQYDGSAFVGWQIQPEGRSVQNELENACGIILKQKIKAVASGRTDTGVHALGQVVHLDMDSEIALAPLCRSLNGLLPVDISVLNAYEVPENFNARFSATERKYLYAIYNNPLRSAFIRHRAVWIARPLDIDYMREAFSYLVGEHDFASFCRTASAKDMNTVRTIHEIVCERKGDFIFVTIRGNAFLHNMVRTIVGTVLDFHKQGLSPILISDVLVKKDRRCSGETALPYGLYLLRVFYDPDLSQMPSAFPHAEPSALNY